ncbi:MAG: flagellar hook-basal body complex protein FliE [Thiomonas sp. 14-64-326]|jgi:flagellar hook-basal body complex protein FliE|uniref:flagellar hook-basal body complex protein FliE n=1 Tax=Thiomonas sp. TaxID=2047785 RepID=UPI000BD73ED1|nr:flagellar hook-basal body complex protein FliE [Thiomonas sp.]OZB73935.1 MAG: flagellar hook-basal body complex protein FliE [Thiomonas sp. 14-64-326]
MQIDPMQSVLAQMRSLTAQAQARPAGAVDGNAAAALGATAASQQSDFATTLKSAIDGVSGELQHANALQQQFVSGMGDVSLSDVMLASQKASLSFQAVLQVRNKLVSAYQDIMNIQA